MTTNPGNIDRVRIATPCPISWEQMAGDNRVRFCDHCHLNVYNISELSRTEAETLIASTEGRLCARLFRRTDGTVLTKDCPVGLHALRRRVAKRTAAVFAAIVSLSAAAFGQQSSRKDKTSCTPQAKITRKNVTSDRAAKVLSGIVLDPFGAVVTGAKVSISNHETKEILQTLTNDEGRFEFGSVAAGRYGIAIELIGFKSLQIKNVIVEKDKLTGIDITLEPSRATVTVGILMEDNLIAPPGTTIINEKMIQSLPHQK